MKLQLLRQSGRPVTPSDVEGYESDFRALYDKAELKSETAFQKRTAKGPGSKGYNVPKVVILQRLLSYGERQLVKKWNKAVEIEVPRSKAGMLKLLSTYEDTPILIAKSTDGKNLVAILMDELQ